MKEEDDCDDDMSDHAAAAAVDSQQQPQQHHNHQPHQEEDYDEVLDEDARLQAAAAAAASPVASEPDGTRAGGSRISCDLIAQPSAATSNNGYELAYAGKLDLPHHPVRLRYLPYSVQRYLLYGKDGYQEMTVCSPPEFYTLQEISWETLGCDCVQTRDLNFYMIARCHRSAVLAWYDEFMFAQNMVEIAYPKGCLSSITTDANCTYLYGTNQELNCVLRFKPKDLELTQAERFGFLWRPFDCCTSQAFNSGAIQFLFVSNQDAGICVFNLSTMEVVAECGDDLSPGAKYLAYDPKRSLLFVSSSCDGLLRCYRFQFSTQPPSPPTSSLTSPRQSELSMSPPTPWSTMPTAATPMQSIPMPSLVKLGDFLTTSRHPGMRLCGPQSVMWDTEMDHLAVACWSETRGRFCVRLFRVNLLPEKPG